MFSCFATPVVISECKNTITNFVFPIPLSVIIFIVKIGDIGYMSFADDLKDFIFNCGLVSLTGFVAFSIVSIKLMI